MTCWTAHFIKSFWIFQQTDFLSPLDLLVRCLQYLEVMDPDTELHAAVLVLVPIRSRVNNTYYICVILLVWDIAKKVPVHTNIAGNVHAILPTGTLLLGSVS